MHLEPVEIQHVKLRRRPLGYDRAAVDQLLEDVAASYEDVWHERANLDAELASLRNRLDGQAKAKAALEGSVRVAQETADGLLADARIRAQAMVDDAHQQALATVREARAEHQRLHLAVRKLEVAETEITLRLRALLTAAHELLEGHEEIRDLAADAADGETPDVAANGARADDAVAPQPPSQPTRSEAANYVPAGSVGPATVIEVELPEESESRETQPVVAAPTVAVAPVAVAAPAAAAAPAATAAPAAAAPATMPAAPPVVAPPAAAPPAAAPAAAPPAPPPQIAATPPAEVAPSEVSGTAHVDEPAPTAASPAPPPIAETPPTEAAPTAAEPEPATPTSAESPAPSPRPTSESRRVAPSRAEERRVGPDPAVVARAAL